MSAHADAAMKRYTSKRSDLDEFLFGLRLPVGTFLEINRLVGDSVSLAITAVAAIPTRTEPACQNCGGDPVRAGIGGNCLHCGRAA